MHSFRGDAPVLFSRLLNWVGFGVLSLRPVSDVRFRGMKRRLSCGLACCSCVAAHVGASQRLALPTLHSITAAYAI